MRHLAARIVAPTFACALIAAAGAVPALAQAKPPAEQETPTFKTGVTEVIVPVTVTDENDRFVSNLKKSDFEIYDAADRREAARITYHKV